MTLVLPLGREDDIALGNQNQIEEPRHKMELPTSRYVLRVQSQSKPSIKSKH
jgi:hypothetical protein